MACPDQLATGRGMVGATISPLSRPAGTLVALSIHHSAASCSLDPLCYPHEPGRGTCGPRGGAPCRKSRMVGGAPVDYVSGWALALNLVSSILRSVSGFNHGHDRDQSARSFRAAEQQTSPPFPLHLDSFPHMPGPSSGVCPTPVVLCPLSSLTCH